MTPPRFLLFVPAWMAERTIARTITSALSQDYPRFRVVCVVDASPDETWTEAKRALGERLDAILNPPPSGDPRDVLPWLRFASRPMGNVILVNPQHLGVIGNTWNVCHHLAEPDEIIVQLDGDDQLAHSRVLSCLAEVYRGEQVKSVHPHGTALYVADVQWQERIQARSGVWLTYGSYANDEASRKPDGSDPRGLSRQITIEDHTRRAGWKSSHLRTWKAWLFRKIRRADLEHLGTWIDAAPDLATMWPMIEMAGPAHARYVREILYLYNGRNPLSESRSKPLQVKAMAQWLQAQPPYVPLAGPGDEARREGE